MTDKFVNGQIEYLRGLKKPSESQQLLIGLFDKTDKTAQEVKTFELLIKNIRAELKAKKAAAAVSNLLQKARSEKEEVAEKIRKERNHGLIQLGLLFHFADLQSLPRAELMGMLLESKKAGKMQAQNWALAGAEFLANREKATPDPAANPAPVPAAADIRSVAVLLNVPKEEKDHVKVLGAKWNPTEFKWWVPAGVDVSLFKKWLPVSSS